MNKESLKKWVFALLSIACQSLIFAQKDFSKGFSHSTEGIEFAQKLVSQLTFKQQLAQTLMVPAWSRENRADEMFDSLQFQKKLLFQIRNLGVGGIIFFQGAPLNQVYLTNYLQQEAQIPLLIGIDGEWGPAMRLTNMEKYPFQMTLGATYNSSLAYQTGKSMAKQCKRLGIHINFAPSIDVNTEPNNPIIGFRSFGSEPHQVSIMGSALAQGMQSEGVLASAKHFPGHGDTKTDSHKDLPVVNKPFEELLREDIAPFETLIQDKVASIMVAHLKVLCVDSVNPYPSSISPKYVSQWLRKDLKFSGLIITDALNMKGVAKIAGAADVALLALKAGNDIILFPEDVIGFLDSAVKSKNKGEIDSAEISERVIRLIATKYDLGLFNNRFTDPVNLESDLLDIKKNYNQLYAQQVADESMIYCRILPKMGKAAICETTPSYLPTGTHKDSLLVLIIGDSIPRGLFTMIQQYRLGTIVTKRLPWNADTAIIDSAILRASNILFLGLDWPTWGNKSRGIPTNWHKALARSNKDGSGPYYLHFGHQYAIQTLVKLDCKTQIVLAHEYNDKSLKSALRMVFGLSHHNSKNNAGLSMLNSNNYAIDIDYANGSVNGYDPELSGILDSLLREGLANDIYPSAQLVVMKNGYIVSNLQVGSVKDMQGVEVDAHQDHVYDIASITKIAATTLAFMKVYENTKGIVLDQKIANYWNDPIIKNSAIGTITFRELLTHQSGLPAFLPLQKMAIKAGAKCVPCEIAGIIENENNNNNQFEIAKGVCLENRWKDSAWRWMSSILPSADKSYVYSDVNMIVLGKWIEFKTGMTLDSYVSLNFYKPMGLKNTSFQPEKHGISLNRIAPTLKDSIWCRGEVRGNVHDPSAMMMGGIAGNAGLFSNAMDLARLMAMLQEKGHPIDGNSYILKPSTVELFTKIHNPKGRSGYRGLGFDKPNGKEGNKANVFEGAPSSLFGHSDYIFRRAS